MDRRQFLRGGSAVVGGVALAGPLQAFAARAAGAAVPASGFGSGGFGFGGGYGPIAPVADGTTGQQLLALPNGFKYWSFDPVGSVMSDGAPVPPAHDGMACFGWGNKVRLVRNHEIATTGAPIVSPDLAYDPTASGGNTIVEFDPSDPSHPKTFTALGGTVRNCAGGETPWKSWLTCEETTLSFAKPHGYVFEVPSNISQPVPAVPLTQMGRFAHEAVAVNPLTSVVYLTEDNGGTSGLYRFVPRRWGKLNEGRLQMLTVRGAPNADLGAAQAPGATFAADWVDIDVPDPADGQPTPFQQAAAKGAASFRRLEGAWWSFWEGRFYFASTDGGGAASGQIWTLRPGFFTSDRLELVYESPSSDALLKPDNLTVSPRRGVLLCEDTDRARQTFLRGLTDAGELFEFAANIRTGTIPGTSTPASFDEFAGASFSSDGRWLFVNIQTPGVTFAITGPWTRGSL